MTQSGWPEGGRSFYGLIVSARGVLSHDPWRFRFVMEVCSRQGMTAVHSMRNPPLPATKGPMSVMLSVDTTVREQHRASNVTAPSSPSCRGRPFGHAMRTRAVNRWTKGSRNVACGEGRIERRLTNASRRPSIARRTPRREFSSADLVISRMVHSR